MAFQANVTLTAITPGILPKQRHLSLHPERNTIPIGRASKSLSKGLVGGVDNAWFDSPVMSREHAELVFDVDKKSLFLKDVQSMHGTRLNNIEIQSLLPHDLKDGDKITFGAEVRRGFEIFPACEFLVEYDIKSWSFSSATTFEVPYSSDVEDEQISDQEYYDEEDERTGKPAGGDDETPVESPEHKVSIAIASVEIGVAGPETDESPSKAPGSRTQEQFADIHSGQNPIGFHTISPDGQIADLESIEDSDACTNSDDDSDEDSEDSENELEIEENVNEELNALYDGEAAIDTDYGDDDDFDVEDAFSPTYFSDFREQEHTSISGADGVSSGQSNTGLMASTNAHEDFGETNTSHESAPLEESANSIVFGMEHNLHTRRSDPSPPQTQTDAVTTYVKNCTIPIESSQEFPEFYSGAGSSRPICQVVDPQTTISFERRPSPSDAAMIKKSSEVPIHHLPHQEWHELTAAQILGEKSGKHAYFAAREDNKAKMKSAVPFAPSGSVTEETDQCLKYFTNVPKESISSTEVAVSENTRALSPEYDMTSAVSFARQKALIEQTLNVDHPRTRSGVTIDELVEHPIVPIPSVSAKRKAVDISTDEAEQAAESTWTPATNREVVEQVPLSSNNSVVVPEASEHRPAKRFRKFAEAVGYAALGGVAVGAGLFSVLVATAPDFL